ncbi:hypothetical protein IJG14_03730 [bacterium]|nr:hypothetical protein [bacterium]
MSKRVLINLYDIVEFDNLAAKLQTFYGYDVYATELSYEKVKNIGIDVKKFDGINDKFDIIFCNFFPISQYLNKNIDEDTFIKNIDSLGLSIIEKYTKKYRETLIVTNSEQYEHVEEYIKNNQTDENLRKKYAQQALQLVCKINSDIIKLIANSDNYLNINSEKACDLLYGENSHQKAVLYKSDNDISYEIINDKELSYNNLIDINITTSIISEFFDVNATVITKHAMPCAAALGSTLVDSYKKAIDCDPISAIDSVIGFSQIVDKQLAKLLKSMSIKCTIAPDYDDAAINLLKENNIKIIKINTPLKDYKKYLKKELIKTPFGILVQDFNNSELIKNTFKVVTKKKPTTEMIEDMVFAWKVAKYSRTNSAIVVKDLATVGIAQGMTSKIDAIDFVLNKACEKSKEAILVTDGIISTTDGILDAAQARIAGIIQPGGGLRDKEIITTADKYEITMIMTGLRQYKNR